MSYTPSQLKRFAQVYHGNGNNAARAAGEVFPSWSAGAIDAHAHKLLARDEVQAELRVLQSVEIVGVLSLAEKRRFLAGVVRAAPLDVADGRSHLTQSVTLTRRVLESGEVEERVQVKMPDKLRAIQLDAQLSGELHGSDDGMGEALAPLAAGMAALMGLAAPPARIAQDGVDSIL